jgi:multidrug transporter EmrE-like cation transporter
MAVLKEKVTLLQWFGVLTIVAGVAGLAITT